MTPTKPRPVEVTVDHRLVSLEQLEEAVGYYLRRHDAPDLRGAYIEARESKSMKATEPPTPSYEPGTVAVATVRGVPEIRVMRLHPDTDPMSTDFAWASVDLVDQKGKPINGFDGALLHNEAEVTEVRELVVIDPATLDFEALIQVFSLAYLEGLEDLKQPAKVRGIRAVLAELKIEL